LTRGDSWESLTITGAEALPVHKIRGNYGSVISGKGVANVVAA
jgi:hypothetical protein